jgi:hypothetical protein
MFNESNHPFNILTNKHHIIINKDIYNYEIFNVIISEHSYNIEGIIQYGGFNSKPNNDYAHKKDDDYKDENKKDEKIINITTHKFKNNIEIKNESSSNNGLKIVGKNKINETFGYKAAMTDDGQMCMITLYIPQNAKIVKDEYYNKYKTNIATVVAIDRIVFNSYNLLKITDVFMKDIDECPICFDDEKLYICSPCHHRLCINCINNIIKSTGNKCPLCVQTIRITIDINISDIIRNNPNIENNLTHAFSCVFNNEFKYELNHTYTILDFDMKIIGKTCGPGIYFHEKPRDIIQWFKHLEIYNEYKKLIVQQNKHPNIDVYIPNMIKSNNVTEQNIMIEANNMNKSIDNSTEFIDIKSVDETNKINNDFLKQIDDEIIDDE